MTVHARWFDPSHKSDRGSALFAEYTRLALAQTYRSHWDRAFLSLLEDLRYNGLLGGGSMSRIADAAAMLSDSPGGLSENIVRELVLAKHSILTRTDPRGILGTSGADYATQERIDRKQAFVDGLITHYDGAALKRLAAMHALAVGTGALKIIDGGDGDPLPRIEIAPSWEFMVDPTEARYGSPWTLYQRHGIDRARLLALYPKHRAEILMARVVTQSTIDGINWWSSVTTIDTDMVEVIEAWRRPIGDKTPGRHTIAISGGGIGDGALLDDDWNDPFPVAFCRFGTPIAGFWGHSLVADLVGIQLELNRTLRARQEALQTIVPYVLVQRNSVVKGHWTNDIGRIVEWTGASPPQVIAPPAVQPEVWQHEANLLQSGTRAARMSAASARGEIPEGLRSGEALRRYTAIEDQRQIDDLRSYEAFSVDLVKRLLESIKRTVENVGDGAALTVQTFGADEISDAEWETTEDPIVVSCAPASSLDQTFAGKMEDMETLRDLGIVTDPTDMMEMMNLPDMRRFRGRKLAARKLCRRIVESRILGDGEAPEISSTWPLQLLAQVASDSLLEAEANPEKYREENVDLLRMFLSEILLKIQATQDEIQQKQAAMQAQAQMTVQGARAPALAPPGPGGAPQ